MIRGIHHIAINTPNLNSFTVRARPLPDGSPIFKAEAAIKNVAGFDVSREERRSEMALNAIESMTKGGA